MSDDECIINGSKDCNSSSDETIVGNKYKNFPRSIISSIDSDSGTNYNDKDENIEDWSEQVGATYIEQFVGNIHVTVAVNNATNLNEFSHWYKLIFC